MTSRVCKVSRRGAAEGRRNLCLLYPHVRSLRRAGCVLGSGRDRMPSCLDAFVPRMCIRLPPTPHILHTSWCRSRPIHVETYTTLYHYFLPRMSGSCRTPPGFHRSRRWGNSLARPLDLPCPLVICLPTTPPTGSARREGSRVMSYRPERCF